MAISFPQNVSVPPDSAICRVSHRHRWNLRSPPSAEAWAGTARGGIPGPTPWSGKNGAVHHDLTIKNGIKDEIKRPKS